MGGTENLSVGAGFWFLGFLVDFGLVDDGCWNRLGDERLHVRGEL